MNQRLEGVLLAAGESRRMGYPKPLLRVNGQTFIAKIAATMLEVAPRLVIVLGAHADRIRPAIPRDPRVTIVENPDFARGQLSSLKVGLGAVRPDAAAVIVHLCDHPMVKARTFREIAESYERLGQPIVIARHDGHRGHPLIFDRSLFAELMAAPEEQGARYVVNTNPSRVVYTDVDDPGIVLDLDTPADLERAGLEPPRLR
jgi:molybdenum cofactor cytidylyltransferase